MTPTGALAGRRAVITGAGRGLGRALAILLADAGAEVVLWGRDAGRLDNVAETIRGRTGRRSLTVLCDLADPESVREATRATLAARDVVDALINNGATWLPGPLERLDEAAIVSAVAATVTGTILVTKGLLPALRRSAAADVVTIVSTSGLPGEKPGLASPVFTASKYGEAGFSDHLRTELKASGIRVTAIYPPDFDDTDPLRPEWNEERTPDSHRPLTNREVVAAVMFALTAPRICSYPTIVLENMTR